MKTLYQLITLLYIAIYKVDHPEVLEWILWSPEQSQSFYVEVLLMSFPVCPSPSSSAVCRDFAVLEDHTLAHSLQEQESE